MQRTNLFAFIAILSAAFVLALPALAQEQAAAEAQVEAEAAEPLLQIGDVVATGHGGAQVEHAITKPEVGLDQCCPGVRPAFAVFHQAACGLKGPNGCHRVRIVDLGVARCRKTGSGESSV